MSKIQRIVAWSLITLSANAFAASGSDWHSHGMHGHTEHLSNKLPHVMKHSATDLVLSQCWARFRKDNVSGVFVTVKNNDVTKPAYIVGVTSPAFSHMMIHETYEQDGMKGMRHLAEITIPAGEEVVLKPGGYHIMAMKPMLNVNEGDKVALVLKLSDGHEVKTQCVMKSLKAQSFDH